MKITDGTSQYLGAGALTVSFPTGQFTTSEAATGASITTGTWATVNGTNLVQ